MRICPAIRPRPSPHYAFSGLLRPETHGESLVHVLEENCRFDFGWTGFLPRHTITIFYDSGKPYTHGYLEIFQTLSEAT